MAKVENGVFPKLSLLAGTPVLVEDLGVVVRQPTLKEIAILGEKEFFQAVNLMSFEKDSYVEKALNESDMTKEEKVAVEEELMFVSDLQMLLATVNSSPIITKLVQDFLLLIIDGSRKVSMSDTFMIISWLNDEIEPFILGDREFEILAQIVPQMFNSQNVSKNTFNPVNDKAAEIAKKIQARRDKVAQETGRTGESTSALGTALSVLSTGDGIPLHLLLDYTIPQLFTQLERTNLYNDFKTQITLGAFGGLKDVDIANWREPINI